MQLAGRGRLTKSAITTTGSQHHAFDERLGSLPGRGFQNLVVNTRTGNRVKAADVFTNLAGLTALVRKAQKKEITDSIEASGKTQVTAMSTPKDLFKDSNLPPEVSRAFPSTRNGVTFHYDLRLRSRSPGASAGGRFRVHMEAA